MLNTLNEDFKEKDVAYWESQLHSTSDGKKLLVRLLTEEDIVPGKLVKRRFSLSDGDSEMIVNQMQLLNWPDHCEYELVENFEVLETIVKFAEAETLGQNMFVHCSVGCGRTGTYLAMLLLVQSLKLIQTVNVTKEGTLFPFFSVFLLVFKLRCQRVGLVSSVAQYKMLYKFVDLCLKTQFNWSCM